MIYLSALLAFFNAYLVARFARVKFAITLTVGFLISAIATTSYFSVASNNSDWATSKIYWGFILVFAVLILLLSNPLRYFIAWMMTFLLAYLVIFVPFEIEVTKTTISTLLIASLVPVIIFRKSIKLILVGIISGTNAVLGLLLILFSVAPTSSYEILSKLTSILYLAGAGFGIYFQFKLYERYFPAATMPE
jgi:hypothetical protein